MWPICVRCQIIRKTLYNSVKLQHFREEIRNARHPNQEDSALDKPVINDVSHEIKRISNIEQPDWGVIHKKYETGTNKKELSNQAKTSKVDQCKF